MVEKNKEPISREICIVRNSSQKCFFPPHFCYVITSVQKAAGTDAEPKTESENTPFDAVFSPAEIHQAMKMGPQMAT